MSRTHCKLNTDRRAFTLVELLIVILIIAILSAVSLASLYAVLGEAKGTRTRTQVAKLHMLVMLKWEGYRVRQVPLPIPGWMKARPEGFNDTNGNCWRDPTESSSDNIYVNGQHDYGGAYIRLLALRELNRVNVPTGASTSHSMWRQSVVPSSQPSNTWRYQPGSSDASRVCTPVISE